MINNTIDGDEKDIENKLEKAIGEDIAWALGKHHSFKTKSSSDKR